MMGTWNPLCWFQNGPVALGPAAGTFTTLLRDQAAVAAAVVGTPAVLGSDGVAIPVAFLNSDIRGYVCTQGHRTTNVTMKWIREYLGEASVPGEPSCEAIEITHTFTAQHGGPCIPLCVKVKKQGDEGMDWDWDYTVVTAVDWQAMLTNLPAVLLDKLLASGHHVCRMTLELTVTYI